MSCPPQGSDHHDGIAAQDHIPGPPDVAAGAEVFWRFAAPPGTSIAGISTSARLLGKAGDQPWRPYGRADGADVRYLRHRVGPGRLREHGQRHLRDQQRVDDRLRRPLRCPIGRMHVRLEPARACGCRSTPPTSWSPIPARPRSPAGRAARCGTPTATTGQPRAPASAAATTRGSPRRTGSSTAANRPLTAAAATTAGRVRAPTWPPDTPSTASNMAAFRDGQHQLQAVVKDAAGNPATAGPINLNIDNTPRRAPGRLTAAPAGRAELRRHLDQPRRSVRADHQSPLQALPGRSRRRTVPGRADRDRRQHLLDHRTAAPRSGDLGPDRLARGRRRQRRHRQQRHLLLGPGRRASRPGRHHVGQGQARSPPSARGPRQAAGDLAAKLAIRYRYRRGKHHKLRSHQQERRRSPRRVRRPPQALSCRPPHPQGHPHRQLSRRRHHAPAKLNQRIKLRRG